MECYYTKREFNEMKNSMQKEINNLKKQLKNAKKKIEELKYTNEVVFEPDFSLNPVTTEG